jgi:paraquat-inducible protein A
MRTPLAELIACRECDLLHHKRLLQVGEIARCQRCHAVLYRHQPRALERALALLLAALLLYIIAIAFPFMAMQVQGQTREINLLASVMALSQQDRQGLALFTFAILLLAPLLRIGGLLYVLIPLYWHRRPPYAHLAYRVLEWLAPWSMMEIYLLGALVALVKLADMGTILLGSAFWAFLLLVFSMSWAGASLDSHSLWQKLAPPA